MSDTAEPSVLVARGDEELMARVAAGDVQAFELIYRRHRRTAFAHAWRVVGQGGIAEEVVQETFFSLWRSAARYDPSRGSFVAWLHSLVHNRGVDRLRREARHTRALTLDAAITERLEATDCTEEQVERCDESHRLRLLLRELPGEQHNVIDLAYFGGLSHTEIASRTHTPLGTVKGRQRLALAKLRRAAAVSSLARAS